MDFVFIIFSAKPARKWANPRLTAQTGTCKRKKDQKIKTSTSVPRPALDRGSTTFSEIYVSFILKSSFACTQLFVFLPSSYFFLSLSLYLSLSLSLSLSILSFSLFAIFCLCRARLSCLLLSPLSVPSPHLHVCAPYRSKVHRQAVQGRPRPHYWGGVWRKVCIAVLVAMSGNSTWKSLWSLQQPTTK